VAGRSCPSGQHPGCGTGGAPVPPDAASPALATSRNDMNVALMSLSRHECGTDVVTGDPGGWLAGSPGPVRQPGPGNDRNRHN